MKKLTETLIQQRLKTCTTDLDKVQQINVTGRELKDVSLLRKMTGIEIVSLSVNHITTLVDFQDCVNLRELYLRQNKISDLNEISYLKKLPKLELLMLSQNPCVDHPKYRMTVIKNLRILTELDGIVITSEERRQAQKTGENVYLSLIDPAENCIPDGPQINRTPTQSNDNLKASDEIVPDIYEYKPSKTTEKVEPTEVTAKKVVDESIELAPSSQISMKKTEQLPPKTKKTTNPSQVTEGSSATGPLCTLCGNIGIESAHPLGIAPKNPNILTATLSLVKELDYPGLQVISAEVCSRINAFEINFICNRQHICGNLKEMRA